MKRTKKIIAIVLSLTVMLTMGTTVFADTHMPTASDTATITVHDVESGATVKAYKIASATYKEYASGKTAFTGYKLAEGVSIANLEAPAADEVAAIAAAINSGSLSITGQQMSSSNGDYVLTGAPAGLYMVLVTNTTGATVYNPMLVSSAYDPDRTASDNELKSGEVSAKDSFTNKAYAKSSTPDVEKEIAGINPKSDGTYEETGSAASTAAVGDTVVYNVDVDIPSYSGEYSEILFKITDTLSNGLTAPAKADVKVTVTGAKADPVEDTDYTVSVSGQVITVDFINDAWLLANGLAHVNVSYGAVVNANAAVNFDPNTNKVQVDFTHDPLNPNDSKPTTDETTSYTFGIDANLNGTSGTSTEQTSEIIKINEEGTTIDSTTGKETISDTAPLAGATFTLYSDADCTKPVKIIESDKGEATTDSKGRLKMTGLDEGTYYLKETAAPSPYKVDSTVHEVQIAATIVDDILKSYTVTIDGTATSTYTATYDAGVIKSIAKDVQTVYIINTSIPELPNTGGIGTYLFYILGTIIMVVAAVMLTRRFRAEKSAR